MKKSTKIWLIAAALLMTAGVILFAAVMTAYHWDFSKLNTMQTETKSYEIGERFDRIAIDVDTADILFAPSEDGKCRVICHEQKNNGFPVTVEDGVLTVREEDHRAWYEHIGINFSSHGITVFLPETEYTSLTVKASTGDTEIPEGFRFADADISVSTGDVRFSASVGGLLRIRTTTGDVSIRGVKAGDIDLTVTTGEAVFADVVCDSITSDGSTGDVSLQSTVAVKKITVTRSTGDVRFNGADAPEIFVKTTTGDVTGSLLTDKVFVTETSTGDVSVPRTTDGGKCEIITSTGDIRCTVRQD